MRHSIWIPKPKRPVRTTGIALHELTENSRFGHNARRELSRWFPSSSWIRRLSESPELCETVNLGRRDALFGATAATLGVALPTAGCSALGVVFELIEIGAKIYDIGMQCGGTATFSNSQNNREPAQLIAEVVQGSTTNAYQNKNNIRDSQEFVFDVPGQQDNWLQPFEGLLSDALGDNFVAGISTGVTLFTKIFSYV
jgi:hypothetical protein